MTSPARSSAPAKPGTKKVTKTVTSKTGTATATRARATARTPARPSATSAGTAAPAGQGHELPREERVRQRAYAFYEQRGGGDGQAMDDWLRAEQAIEADDLQAARSAREGH